MRRQQKRPPFKRTARVADLIARELALAFLEQAADPRIHQCTVTSVEVSKDLHYAKVMFSTLEHVPGAIEQVRNALQNAEGFFKRILSENLKLRFTPALQFVHDDSLAYGAKMLALIKEVNADHDPDESDDS